MWGSGKNFARTARKVGGTIAFEKKGGEQYKQDVLHQDTVLRTKANAGLHFGLSYRSGRFLCE